MYKRQAYIFGRDGGLTKIDLLEARIVKRVMQAGNSIGGSISQDGRIVVAQNYTPGGIKAFDAETLDLLSEVPAEYAPVSYTHLDVYKRQFRERVMPSQTMRRLFRRVSQTWRSAVKLALGCLLYTSRCV